MRPSPVSALAGRLSMRLLLLIGLLGLAMLALNVRAQGFIPAETDHVQSSNSTSDITGSSYYGDLSDDEDSNTLDDDERLSVNSRNPFPIIFKARGVDDEDTTPDDNDSSSDGYRLASTGIILVAAYNIL